MSVIKVVAENEAGTELCEFENAKNIRWSRFLSSIGELFFTLKKDDAKFANLTPLKTYLKVTKDGVAVWRGVYDFLREDRYKYSIFASTFESLLKYYLVDPTNAATSSLRAFTGKKLGTEVAKILFDEAVAKTSSKLAAFTDGTIENPYTPATTTEMTPNMEFNYDQLYEAITNIAKTGGADWEIGLDKTFNFYRRKGSNKPDISFRFYDNQPSNMVDYTRDLDFRKISNKLYTFGVGVGANYLKSTSTDATSTSSYGLMEGNLGMPKVLVDQASLDKVTAQSIAVFKDPNETISPSILPQVVLFDGWSLGDNVTVEIVSGGTSLSAYKRIIGVLVSYTDSHTELVTPYLDVIRA